MALKGYYNGFAEDAISVFDKANDTVGMLNTMRFPRQFRREEDIAWWSKRFFEACDRFESARLLPKQLFDSLFVFETFELPYSGIDVTPHLARVGSIIRNRIVRKALPSLCQPIEKRRCGDKIKVCYVSPHMYAHNGARWAHGWIVNHAPDIEAYVYNIGAKHDFVSHKIGHSVERYEWVDGRIHQIAKAIKDEGFDIIIHPAIGMNGMATQLAAMNLAPVQMTAWGHPVTSGMDSVDYYLSSDLMEPVNGQDHYTEELVRLPGSGLCYPAIAPEDTVCGKTREELGLPERYIFVAQNVMKIPPKWDALLIRCQRETGLPLIMQRGAVDAEAKIVGERIEAAGGEVLWLPRCPRPQFLSMLKFAECSLDIPSWNGGNTTVEAIHFGTPIVTLPGEFMRGRHSLCFLKQAGLDRFIAKDADDYVRLVSEVVKTRERLPEGSAGPIFDNKEPVQALDALFRTCVN